MSQDNEFIRILQAISKDGHAVKAEGCDGQVCLWVELPDGHVKAVGPTPIQAAQRLAELLGVNLDGDSPAHAKK